MLPYSYNRAQLNLFYDLVQAANPGITKDLMTNAKVGTPASQSVPSTGFPANTNILINGVQGYIGNVRVTYRRIDLSNTFKNNAATLTDYSATSTLAIATVIASLNKKYGLALVAADFAATSINSGSNTLTFSSTSLCYTGSFTVTWTPSKQPITAVLANNSSLTGRLWPSGNTFDGTRKPQGEYLCYDSDFTALAGTVSGLTTGTLDYTVAAHKAIIDYLTNNISATFNGTAHTNNGGLNGLAFAKYTMPTANAPEANSASTAYNTVFVITAQSTSWFQGKILLHLKI